ncbi:MAG: zinc-binding dehydrogenase, partial [Elusimicrobia bacterium]|nr:zinc-binding dehydrogenase [Elusimicrobiota bacterium]
IGAGTIGLLAVALANHARPGRLVVLGNDSARNQIALLLGASHAVLAGPDAVERVRELTGGGPHVVIEAAGTPLAVEQAFDVVRPGGRVVLEGVIGGGHRSCLATDEWVVKDITVHGVMGADRASVRGVVDLLSRGLLNVLPVIRDVLPLAEFPEALRRLREERECPPKILLAARSG